jgi:hypothetical protein
VKKITETSKLNISLVETILSEEKCGEGMYWCNTNKECKPLPSGFNTPGQTIKPTEVGIGVPVEGSCNHTKKGKICPKHGMKDCTLIGETLNSVTEEGIRAWFRSKSKDNVPGWVDVVTGDSCASDKPGEGITKCVSSSKRDSMTSAERRSAKARKRAADPGQQEKSNAAKPTYVSTDSPTKKMKEEFFNENHKAIAGGKEKDEEGYMASTEMDTIDSAVKKLRKNIKKGDMQLPAWVQSKITKASDYIDTAADYLNSKEMSEESDAKGKGSGTKDACYHKVKSRYSVWPSAYASGALVKCRKVGAANWGNKSESLSPISLKVLEDLNLDEKCWAGYKKKGMKTMFGKRYPNCVKVEEASFEIGAGHNSAKRKAKIRNLATGTTNPNEKSAALKKLSGPSLPLADSFELKNNTVDEATRLQADTGNILAVILSWRGKTYSVRMFFPQVGMPNRKDVTSEIQKIYPGALVLQYKVSSLQPGMPLIQVVNSKSKNYAMNEGAAWTKKSGKNSKGGLNEKGRKSYEADNPGSDLKAPSKKVGNPRRASFCARMKGMKAKLTSAKTARDPDSRINKSLRAWNC